MTKWAYFLDGPMAGKFFAVREFLSVIRTLPEPPPFDPFSPSAPIETTDYHLDLPLCGNTGIYRSSAPPPIKAEQLRWFLESIVFPSTHPETGSTPPPAPAPD
jgi:hypothetical protein